MKKLHVIFFGFAIILLWIVIISFVLEQLFLKDGEPNKIGAFIFTCICAPLWEELVYRHAPLQIAKKLGKSLKKDFVIPVVILSSAIFGWGHGDGVNSLLIQGVGGVVLCYVYITNGFSYWSSVTVHFLWNLTIVYLIPFLNT